MHDALGHPQQHAGTCPQEGSGRELVSMKHISEGHSVALSLCPSPAPFANISTALAQPVAQFLPGLA